jgi:hypothetical protein
MIGMLPTNGFYILLLDLAVLAAMYFAILLFWIYPDAQARGLKPKDYAIMGFMLLVFLNIVGIIVLMVVYVDDRKKLPTKHLRQARYWQNRQARQWQRQQRRYY